MHHSIESSGSIVKNLKSRISRYLDKGRPPSISSIDFVIRELGGGDTNTILLKKLPPKYALVSPQVRIAQLNEEIRQLEGELKFHQCLIDDVLLRIMPKIHIYYHEWYSVLQTSNECIEQAFAERVQLGTFS